MRARVDHLLWAVPDLDEGVALFHALTGVEPAAGGSHDGFGTRNRLLSLGDGVYFEIIGPDPAQRLADNLGARIAAMSQPQLMGFALRSEDLDGVCDAARGVGLTVQPPVSMGRTRADGVRLDWTIVHLADPRWPDFLPFVIDWKGSPHPADTTPGGCTLKDFTALSPEPEPLAEVYRAIGVDVAVRRSTRPGLMAVLGTPRGDVLFIGP